MAVTLYQNDIPAHLNLGPVVAVDTESMGLNWDRDRLCVIQLSSGDGHAHLVQLHRGKYEAFNLKKLFADPKTVKLFHFARADLAAIGRYLGVIPQPVYCTKIASLVARTFTDRHGLKDIARDLINVDLSKEQQTSDWGAETLSQDQLNYAASDVYYLHRLKDKLDDMLAREGRTELALNTMACLPARAALDLAGWDNIDIFAHSPLRRGA